MTNNDPTPGPSLSATIDAISDHIADAARAEEEARTALRRENLKDGFRWLVELVEAIQADMADRFGLWDDAYTVEVFGFCDHAGHWWGGTVGADEEWAAGRWPTSIDIGCNIGSNLVIVYTIGPRRKSDGSAVGPLAPLAPTDGYEIETRELDGFDVNDAKTLLELLKEEVEG